MLIPHDRNPTDPFPNRDVICPKMFDDNLNTMWHGPHANDPDNPLINLPADKISIIFKVSIEILSPHHGVTNITVAVLSSQMSYRNINQFKGKY